MRQVQKDLDSMQIRRHQTWKERQAIAAWGRHDRRRIFTEYVSRKPLYHSKCDQCHEDLNHYSVRCMTCQKHLCYQCDTNTHSGMPFHRRLFCSCDRLEILQPDHFIDAEGNIITKDICVPCFVHHKCCDISCHGSMSLIPNVTESIVVVTEQGRFVLKGATFVCDTCDSLTKPTIDDYVFSGFYPASLSETVTYLFSEEALLLCHHISHKYPGSSKNMYAHTLEEVSKEYGRNGPINIPLFTNAEREWETCRHYIDQEVFKRNKIDCPTCGTKPLVRSSDAIIKLGRLASAGNARKPENKRVIDDVESRFENLVIKSDVEDESFRQRIYNKVQTSKKKNMCGGSAFKAAGEDSNENKKYDETGIVISSCKHCIVPYAISLCLKANLGHTRHLCITKLGRVRLHSFATMLCVNIGNGCIKKLARNFQNL
ncbi:uncharacterized protein LOC116923942 [Daphnia magna]|uniref:uncharacterized protein LOC116923942 n=1 Tax=Daphnia magna TaxID=35525 RepID=UPI001E1BD056|nr:uncharacterized protein LOC116923942 [Daphnia magna]